MDLIWKGNSYLKLALYLMFFEILILSCNSKPQITRKTKIEHPIMLPPDNRSKFDEIGFACYESGRMSPIVAEFTKDLSDKNYKSLRNKLFSPKSGEIYLATIICQKLSHSGIIKLTKTEENQIKINQNKKDSISTCSGCTAFENFTINKLINDKDNYIRKEAEWWLEKTIKEKEN